MVCGFGTIGTLSIRVSRRISLPTPSVHELSDDPQECGLVDARFLVSHHVLLEGVGTEVFLTTGEGRLENLSASGTV